ncbi:putative POM121-like protein 1 [Plecturocebus cupreus]
MHGLHLGPAWSMEASLPSCPGPGPAERPPYPELYGRLPVTKEEEGASLIPLPAALTSSKTVSEDSPSALSGCSTREKLPQEWLPASQASRPRGRKFLVLPRRQGEPGMLPPPLQLGFRVTAEDLDLEKSALHGVRPRPSGTAEPHRFPTLCPHRQQGRLLCLLSLKHPTWMHSRRDRKSQDGLGSVALLASAAGSACRCPVSGKKSRTQPRVTSLIPAPFPAASMDHSMAAQGLALLLLQLPQPPFPLHMESHMGVPTEWSAKRPFLPWASATVAPGAQDLSAPGLQVASSEASASAPASTSANLAPQAARDSQGLPPWSGCFSCSPGLIFCSKTASPGHHSTLSRRGFFTQHFHLESPTRRKLARAAGLAGTIPGPSASSGYAPTKAR